jgi:hypothetical protein
MSMTRRSCARPAEPCAQTSRGSGLRIRTVRDCIQNGYRIHGECRPCGRFEWLDLDALVREGYGDRSIIGAEFRCRRCRRPAQTRLHAPAPRRGPC